MDLNDEDGIWDSVLLEPLTEETFISNLNCRYDSNTNYVSNLIIYYKIKNFFNYIKDIFFSLYSVFHKFHKCINYNLVYLSII